MKDVKVLRLPSGKEPFKEWFDKFDITTRSKIRAYIDRVALGGDKSSQKKDIKKAKELWSKYVSK